MIQVLFFLLRVCLAAFVSCVSGNMRVRLSDSSSATVVTYIWSKTGNQGTTWNTATVDIGELPAGYKVWGMLYGGKQMHASGSPYLYKLYDSFLSIDKRIPSDIKSEQKV